MKTEAQKAHARQYSAERHKKMPWLRYYFHAKARCTNKNNQYYYCYGGRGIKMLLSRDEIMSLWFRDKGYELKRPSIDRIDPNGNYELNNCRFIELSQNSYSSTSFRKGFDPTVFVKPHECHCKICGRYLKKHLPSAASVEQMLELSKKFTSINLSTGHVYIDEDVIEPFIKAIHKLIGG